MTGPLDYDRERPFAALRACPERSEGVTQGDCSNGQGRFVQIEPCLNKIARILDHPRMADQAAVGAIMSFYKIIRIPDHPLRADNALSKMNTDDETGLCAVMASSIIQFNFLKYIIGHVHDKSAPTVVRGRGCDWRCLRSGRRTMVKATQTSGQIVLAIADDRIR
jgi:hypothetical protein